MPPEGGTALYSLDTSAILNPWRRYYPPDVFPSIWRKMEEIADARVTIASEEVLFELERKDDEVCEWAKQRPHMFVPIDEAVQQAVRRILRGHPRLIDTRKNRSGADPFVIALALARACTVVTYEARTGRPDRPNIPDVCAAVGVRCISFVDLIRELEWQI